MPGFTVGGRIATARNPSFSSMFPDIADIVGGAETVAGQYEALPSVIVADRQHVGGKLVKGGQILFSCEHPLNFGSDCAPLRLDHAGPWEDGFVVNRRISNPAQSTIEVLHPSNDSHEKTGDERWTLHRSVTGARRFLLRIMLAAGLRLCNTTQTASPEFTDAKTGLCR